MEKFYTVDREWRYNPDTGKLRNINELIARREIAKIDDHKNMKEEIDEQTIT